MRMNRFSSAVLISIVLCTSENDRSFAAGNGDTNENVASTATPEEAAMQAAAYKARLAARAAADEGFFLGRRGDFRAARKKFSQAIELDPNYAEIFNERGFARRQLGDLHGARDDFDRCITLGTDLPLAYGNRAEVELMLADDSAAADFAQAQSLAAKMPDSPAASSTPSARKNQTYHKTPRTRPGNNVKGTTR
jgi:Flp pilus assembly protein TadD